MNIPLAKRYIKVIFWETLVISMILATVIYTAKAPIFGLFTKDEELF